MRDTYVDNIGRFHDTHTGELLTTAELEHTVMRSGEWKLLEFLRGPEETRQWEPLSGRALSPQRQRDTFVWRVAGIAALCLLQPFSSGWLAWALAVAAASALWSVSRRR